MRNDFKDFCKNKLLDFQRRERKQLYDIGNNASMFWRKIKRTYIKPCIHSTITADEWYTYFGKLLYDTDAVEIDNNENTEFIDVSAN
ncbi:hypothetical protein DPMN_007358 [Dreissena polymorpha]|uniref:Uncharacterized protein n=1 Tax=Dreissena polymorpha TaxID=45954 RepID=A0A9D4MW27_DREPO|nr:hypothetical protein DPMN_007358 [Dreissena polymorpha]